MFQTHMNVIALKDSLDVKETVSALKINSRKLSVQLFFIINVLIPISQLYAMTDLARRTCNNVHPLEDAHQDIYFVLIILAKRNV